VYHANSINPDNQTSIKAPDKYMLFVGGRNHYKNFTFFISSIRRLLIDNRDLKLLCVGGGNFSKDEIELIDNLGLKESVLHTKADDRQLTFLYKNAICFVYPSRYEGFGIPILEAFACDCPITISNASCFPEIAADAAIYFDPYDEKSIIDTIEKVYKDDVLRDMLVSLGRERLKKFSWQQSANKTYNIYREAKNIYNSSKTTKN
jgi:glycosyltransferase involved in cell wall biosynthesis